MFVDDKENGIPYTCLQSRFSFNCMFFLYLFAFLKVAFVAFVTYVVHWATFHTRYSSGH